MRTLVVGLIALAALGGGVARAEPGSGVRLDWRAPSQCPTGAQVEAEIGRLLASSTVGTEGVSATATVSRAARGWSVVLTTHVRGVRGRRALSASSCESLAHATAIVLALTIDPNAQPPVEDESAKDEPAAPADASAPPTLASPETAPPEPPVRPSAVDVPSRSVFAVGASVVGAVGQLPHLAFAPELMAAWMRAGWRAELSGAYFPPVHELVDARRGGDFRLLVGAVRACRTWRLGEGAELGPCVAFEGGAMNGEGVGVRAPGSGAAPWLAVRAGALGAGRLGNTPIWLTVTLDGALPLTRYRFALDAVGIVHHEKAVVGRASLGAEVRFE